MPDAALARRVGHAFSLESGKPVYREIHQPQVQDGQLVGDDVRYVDPSGQRFAHKHVQFGQAPLAPAFRLEDERTGYVEGLKYRDDGRMVLFHRKDEGAEMESATLAPPDDVVADAGFDRLIYRKLDPLVAGETLRFPFAAPSQLDTITFRLQRIDRRKVLGQEALVVRMEPDSVFIRFLADPIDVAYSIETGALLRYEGLSNIPNPNADGNYRVRIDFPPEGVEPRPPDP